MADPVARGHRAATELEETAAAFARVRDGYVKQLLAALDPEDAFRRVLMVRALDDAQADLNRVIDAGKVAERFPSQ